MISDDEASGWSHRNGGGSSRRGTEYSNNGTDYSDGENSDNSEYDELMYKEIKKSHEANLAGKGNNGTTTMGTARKLFLLDQLKRPSPGSDMTQTDIARSKRSTGIGKGAHAVKSRPKNVRKTRKNIEKRISADRLTSRMIGICTRLENEQLFVAKQMGNKSYWSLEALVETKYNRKFAIGVLVDVCRLITALHDKEMAYGTLTQSTILLDRNLDVYLEAPKTVGVRGAFNIKRIQADKFEIGVLMLELANRKFVSNSFCPNVYAVKTNGTNGFSSDMLKTAMVSIEQEVKEAMKTAPRYIVEHCMELLQLSGDQRPPISQTMERLIKYKRFLGSDGDEEEKLRILKLIILDTKVVRSLKKNPQILDTQEDDGIRRTISTSKPPKLPRTPRNSGYETDDSYYVAPDPEDKKKNDRKKRKSAIGDFLNATADTNQLDPKPSSQSVSGEITRRKSRFSEYTDIDDGDLPKKPPRRTRRRSLDKNYLDAKRTLERDVKAGVGITADNLQAFKDAWAAKEKARELRGGKMKPEKIATRFENQERLSPDLSMAICRRVIDMLKEEPNNLQLEGPVTVVGDIHGQYFDLRNMLKQCGLPGSIVGDGKELNSEGEPLRRTYLFLGDYVDRGNFSCEVLLYLFALKCEFQEYVWLLRGNHESRATCGYFGFKEECERKYGVELFNKCCDAFQAMPLAATVSTPGGRFFCLHGGISPNVTDLHQFAEFDRFAEPDMNGFLCDVLWADPVTVAHDDDEDELDAVDRRQALGSYFPNTLRGCSYRFGLSALQTFLEKNNLVSIIRAHQVQNEGYHYHFQELVRSQWTGAARNTPIEEITPPVVTVFSAPNYCGTYDNKAAYINVGKSSRKSLTSKVRSMMKSGNKEGLSMLEPVQFEAVEEPKLIEYANAKKQNELDIEKMCPYMPNEANAFINKALKLRELDSLDELINRQIDASDIHLDDIDDEVEEEQVVMPKRLEKLPSVRADDPSTWKSIAERTKEFQKAAKKSSKYRDAAKKDRLMEMNPLKLEQIKRKAQQGLNIQKEQLHLPQTIKIKEEEERRRRASQRLSQRLSRQLSQKEITFTQKELLALQTLFLLIDRDEKGKIGAFDIVLWSEGEGASCSPQEAYIALEIVDFDKDGFIGFEDYLVFAACAKKLWLAERFAKAIKLGNDRYKS